jgi:hypothetical protein
MDNAEIKGLIERVERLEAAVFNQSLNSKQSQKVESTPALLVANKVGDCDERESIQSRVLDKRNMEAKVLLCFYISYKYFSNVWLTSGDVEKVTSDLGVKIDKKNVSNKLRETRRYLESKTTIRKGQPTPYRLNRQGVKRFEEILNNEEG